MSTVIIKPHPTMAQTFGMVAAMGAAMGLGRFQGGINWKHSGRRGITAYRAKRKHRNRIASRSRARNRA